MRKINLPISKMTGETEQQYIAWLLYCEAGSIPKMIQAWELLGRNIGETSGIFGDRILGLGKLPAERNIEKWSSKYHWVERKELKLQEDAEILNKKLSNIILKEKYEVVIAFGYAIESVLKRLKDPDYHVTIDDLKTIWEMACVELDGLDLGEPDERELIEKDELSEEVDEIMNRYEKRKERERKKNIEKTCKKT